MTTQATPCGARLMAWLVVVVAAAFLVLGLAWYGFSLEVHKRIWRDIAERPGGPMAFRFLLQPAMAAIAAVHDGVKDVRTNRSPYFWTVLHDPGQRGGRLREGLLSTARIILLGLGMDAIYQWRVLGTFYPGEALVVALLLAVVPYFLLRGPVCRIARRFLRASSDTVG
jgi:hypothetical protein